MSQTTTAAGLQFIVIQRKLPATRIFFVCVYIVSLIPSAVLLRRHRPGESGGVGGREAAGSEREEGEKNQKGEALHWHRSPWRRGKTQQRHRQNGQEFRLS